MSDFSFVSTAMLQDDGSGFFGALFGGVYMICWLSGYSPGDMLRNRYAFSIVAYQNFDVTPVPYLPWRETLMQ